MTPNEARLVRGRLDEYNRWGQLAMDAEKELGKVNLMIADEGSLTSPQGKDADQPPTQNPTTQADRLNDLIGRQTEWEWTVVRYQQRQKLIEDFIEKNINEEHMPIFVARFIDGMPYESMIPGFARSYAGIHSIVDRELGRIDFDQAKHLL